jgi:ubiquinol-cytochrome c reductase cytochrome b subunit
VDERLGAAAFLRRNIRKAFPDHWSFLLGEIALYCFIVLVLTGTFLTLFFKPAESETVYNGAYTPLRGVRVSEAYASTLQISFDVRGGLLVRQIHHWAAILFIAAICVHLMRIFFTGAFRKPRELNWLIGTTMFALALAEGFAGYSLPDDLLSGTGLRIAQGIMLSIPIIGTYVSSFVFGGGFPGEDFIPRLFTIHILLIPGLLLGLIGAHLMLVWHQKHTQWPSTKRNNTNVGGNPTYPKFMLQTTAFLMFAFAVLAALATFAQINPIWLYGPYQPAAVSTGSQPDWYVGFLEGSLRIMPPLRTEIAGHTISWNVFLPAAVLPVAFLTLIALYPFFERWVIGDARPHHLCDRPVTRRPVRPWASPPSPGTGTCGRPAATTSSPPRPASPWKPRRGSFASGSAQPRSSRSSSPGGCAWPRRGVTRARSRKVWRAASSNAFPPGSSSRCVIARSRRRR